jgi:hypothetical protein
VLLAFVLLQGADVLAYLDRPRWSARAAGSPAEKAGILPATRSRSSAPPTSHVGTPRDGGRARPEREVESP